MLCKTPIEIGAIIEANFTGNQGNRPIGSRQQITGPGDPNPIDKLIEAAAGSPVKKAREMAFTHAHQSCNLRQGDLLLVVAHHKLDHQIDFSLKLAIDREIDLSGR